MMRKGFSRLLLAGLLGTTLGSLAEASWPKSKLVLEEVFEREGDRSEELASLLFEMPDADAVGAIERAVVDRDPKVRALGARRAELMRHELGPQEVAKFLTSADQAENALGLRLIFGEFRGETLRLVLKLGGSSSGEVRRLVARALSLAALEEGAVATALAIKLSRDADEGVRTEAAFALARLGGSDAKMAIEGLLSDPVENVRVAGLRARCGAGDAPTIATSFLRDPSWRLRVAAYACLFGAVADEEFSASLAARVDETDGRTFAFAFAFGKLSRDRAAAVLAAFLADDKREAAIVERVVGLLVRTREGEEAVVRALLDRKGRFAERIARALRSSISELTVDALLEANAEGRISNRELMAVLVRSGSHSEKVILRALELLESDGSKVALDVVRVLSRNGTPSPLFSETLAKFGSDRRLDSGTRRSLLALSIGTPRGAELGRLMTNSTSIGDRALGRLLAAGGDGPEKLRSLLAEGHERSELVSAIHRNAGTMPLSLLLGIARDLPPGERKELLGSVRERKVLRPEDEVALIGEVPKFLPAEREMLSELVAVLSCERDRGAFALEGRSRYLEIQVEKCPRALFENETSRDPGVRVLSLLRLSTLALAGQSAIRARTWFAREAQEAGFDAWQRKALLLAGLGFGNDGEKNDEAPKANDRIERRLKRALEEGGRVTREYETRALLGTLSGFETSTYSSLLGMHEGDEESRRRCALLARDEGLARSCLEPRGTASEAITVVVGSRGARVRSVPLLYMDATGMPSLGFSDAEGRLPTRGRHPVIFDASLVY